MGPTWTLLSGVVSRRRWHFQRHFSERNFDISISISIEFIPKASVNKSALVKVMVWNWICWDKMAAISEMKFINASCLMKMFVFLFRFHRRGFQGSIRQKASIGSHNGFTPNRQQAMIWNNGYLVYWCIYTSCITQYQWVKFIMIKLEMRQVKFLFRCLFVAFIPNFQSHVTERSNKTN